MKKERRRDTTILRGRVSMLYSLSQNYLFLPFAALCMAAALVYNTAQISVVATPLVLQIAATIAAGRLKDSYDAQDGKGDPRLWAHRYAWLSGGIGAIWGVGAVIWFVPDNFPAEAYLSLAFLGMTATEFVARSAYRPAYLAHAAASLGPLAAMLLWQGGLYQMLTAILVMFFGGVLYSYCGNVSALYDEGILLRDDNAKLIQSLSSEKQSAETARDAAQNLERAKSAFISNISHEIRTPLNAILGMAQLLERSDLEKAQRDHVKVLLEAGLGLKTLLDDIIALAHQDGDSLRGPDEGCDALQATRTVGRLLQPNAWEKRLRVSINAAPNLPRVTMDPRQLRRVLVKLVSNAIKFTERGTVEVALDTLTTEDGKKFLRFKVNDTGPGIPIHVMNTIFEPFSKTDESYSRRHNGAGVGLAVAKTLVEQVGGEIGVESEPGAGASFWFTVPAIAEHTQGVHDDNVPAPSGLQILVCATNAETRAKLDQYLTPFGNQLIFAETLADMVSLSVRGGFPLVIAEGNVVDALAATPGQRTPILALAASDERPPDGADAMLRWPASASSLYGAITAAIGIEQRKSAADVEAAIDAAIDARAFAELEKSLGLKTLLDILQSYLATAEELTTALTKAQASEDWPAAGRLAQDIAGAAGGLGLAALTSAARTLAQNARDAKGHGALAIATSDVLAQHTRVREALKRLYPNLAA